MSLLTPTPSTETPDRPDAGPAGARRGRPWRAFLLGLAILVLAAPANGPELVRTAERQPLGWRRDVLVDVATVVAEVGDVTRLDRPRRWLEEALDRDRGAGPPPAPVLVPAPPPGNAPTSAPAAAPTSTTAAPSPTTTVPARRRPTADEPLRLWIAGDSMMQVVGQSVVNGAGAHGAIESELEFRVSTGLTRPDYFDWMARLAEILAAEQPEALVVMFGANDAQGIVTASGPASFGTDAWVAEYRARTAAAMDLVAGQSRRVYWVGQPIMRDDGFSSRMAALNEIYRSEAAARDDVVFVDSWSVFAVDGAYSAYLDQGGPTLMRQSDGIHLTRAGGDRLAGVILDAIRADWFEER